jgi:very-short-patch-repair endonuclease
MNYSMRPPSPQVWGDRAIDLDSSHLTQFKAPRIGGWGPPPPPHKLMSPKKPAITQFILGTIDRRPNPKNPQMHSHPRKTDRVRGVSANVQKAARSLRDNMTDAEELLWSALRNKQLLGLRFRRQHAVGNFILDFYCPAYKLAIEVDGAVHDDRQTEDALRTQKLEQHNYQVLRFHNEEIFHDLDRVLQSITTSIQSRQTTPKTDSGPPKLGG